MSSLNQPKNQLNNNQTKSVLNQEMVNLNQNENSEILIINDRKKLKIIKILGIVSLVVGLVSAIIFLPAFLWLLFEVNQIVVGSNDSSQYDSLYWFILNMLIVLVVIPLVAASMISFAGSIMILSVNWINENLKDSKILWGILGLLLLGPIALLIFSNIKL